jgi:hypothetical protein
MPTRRCCLARENAPAVVLGALRDQVPLLERDLEATTLSRPRRFGTVPTVG